MSMTTPLRSAEVPALLEHLARARQHLACLSLDERLAGVGRAARAWLSDDAGLQADAESIAAATGYAPSMTRECIERTLGAWNESALRDVIHSALARPASIATLPELVVVVLAQNTPALAVAPTFVALALGSAVVLKPSRGEPTFSMRLAERLGVAHPALGNACAVRFWKGGDDVECTLFPRASRVVAYGPQATLDRARALAGERVIAHGPRVSVAVVGHASNPRETAARLARDVSFLDQRGCLSPQAILVEEGVDRENLGRALADELAKRENEWPRRTLGESEALAFRHAVDEAEARCLGGEQTLLLGGVRAPWAVVVDDRQKIVASPLDRFIRLHPFAGAAGLSQALAPLAGRLECVGLDRQEPSLVRACREAGAARICTVGDMQDPPAAWHAGGRPPADAYLTWTARGSSGAGEDDRRKRFLRHVAQTSTNPRGLDVDRARGSWIYTRDGGRHLDLLAGIGVASIGHGHPRVAAAVAEQSAKYTHLMVYGEDVLAPQVDLATRLATKLPSSLSAAYFTNSGAEAIEGALKLIRKATGRDRVLAFEGAYHGDTTGAMALGGNPFYREPFRPLLGPVEHLSWNDASALTQIDEQTAGVFIEPVQAEGGVRVPSPDFLPALAARCREVGALLVFDEVVTALGRTGRWFGFEHWPGSEPDVLVLAKSLGGGLPLGAFVSSPERLRALSESPPLGHVTTFGGNPVCCAAALASLDVLEEQRLPERAATVGARFSQRLGELVGRGVVDVRSIGLLLGIEFESPQRTMAFADGCRDNGVLLGWTLHQDCVVRLAPPLTITDDEIDFALSVMKRVLR